MKWRTANTNTILFEKRKFDQNCHSLSLLVIRCHRLSLVVPLVVIRCHLLYQLLYHWLSLVVPLVVIRCHSLYHSLSLDVPLVWLFINDPEKSMIFISEISIIIKKNKLCLKKYSCDLFLPELRQFLAWKRSFLKIYLGGGGVTAPGPPLPPAHVPIIAMYFVCTGPEKESVSCNY